MKAILHFLERESVWPLILALLSALILLPGLGSHGLWEPQEIRVADRASERAGLIADDEPAESAESARRAPATRSAPASEAADDARPPLTEWSAGQGMKHIAASELGARLPLALLGITALLATFFLGRRLASARAGLIAALVLLSLPLFLFQSRQLLSHIGAVTGSALIVLGLVGLIWPAGERRRLWHHALDVALVAVGAALSYAAAAALLGLVVPFGAMALACLAGLSGRLHAPAPARPAPDREPRSRRYLAMAGLLLLAIALAVATAVVASGAHPDDWLAALLAPALLGAALVAASLTPARPRPQRPAGTRRLRGRLLAAALGTGAVAVAALHAVLSRAFDLKDPIPGERALLGHSLIPTEEATAVLGGTWRLRDDLGANIDVLFEQIAFGLFPWVALAPIAIAYLGMGQRGGRRAWSGFVLLGWAALAWVVASIMARKVGPVLYPALVPVAVAVGIWLDDLMSAREQADATAESDPDARAHFGVPLRPALAALFACLATLVVAKDISTYPDTFLSINVTDGDIKYPPDTTLLKLEIKRWIVLFGGLFAVALAGGLLFWTRHKQNRAAAPPLYALRRYGVHAAVGIALVHALFLTQCWTPAMSRKLSSKHIFSVYHDLRQPGDELGIMGDHGSGPRYYAGGEYQRLASRNALLDFLRKEDGRVFALAPASELCAIHRAIKGAFDYHVLDDTNAKLLLLSNRLERGESDRNPLSRAVLREPPADIQTPLAVNFDNTIELIGVNMPASVSRGSSFEMTLFFRVQRPVSGNWKIFVHFDGAGLRFQGDHEPINGRCGTSFWQPGDYIVDTFKVEAGNFTYAKTAYSVNTGFFRGSFGNWTNMTVTSATTADGAPLSAGSDNRVRIGQVTLE